MVRLALCIAYVATLAYIIDSQFTLYRRTSRGQLRYSCLTVHRLSRDSTIQGLHGRLLVRLLVALGNVWHPSFKPKCAQTSTSENQAGVEVAMSTILDVCTFCPRMGSGMHLPQVKLTVHLTGELQLLLPT